MQFEPQALILKSTNNCIILVQSFSSRKAEKNHKNPSVSFENIYRNELFLAALTSNLFPFLRRPQAQFPVGRDT